MIQTVKRIGLNVSVCGAFMSSFSGRTPKPLEGVMVNDGFFPDLTLLAFQETYRIRSAYREATIKQKLEQSIFSINRLLNERKAFWLGELLETYLDENDLLVATDPPAWALSDVPCLMLGELHEYVELYKRAVFSLAKAELMRVFDGMNRLDRADNDDDEEDIQHFLNDSEFAVNELLGECEVKGTAH